MTQHRPTDGSEPVADAAPAVGDGAVPPPSSARTSSRVWLLLVMVNAVLIAANYPRAVSYLHDLRPDTEGGSLTTTSYSVGAALAMLVVVGICLLYYSLAAQLDRLLWQAPLLWTARCRVGYFGLVAALSTTVPNGVRLALGEFRVADRPVVASIVFTFCVVVPVVLSRSMLAELTSRRRITVLVLSVLLPALVIFG